MSLNELTMNLAGHDQPDVASLDLNGLHYRCYVWLNLAQYRVDAACYVVQGDGSEVLVFANSVVTTTATEQTNTAGYPLDCPKILASGQHFVVHWLQADDMVEALRNWELFRATMDMEAFSASSTFGWTNHGSIALDQNYLLYDAHPVIGAAVEPTLGGVPFVVARSISSGTIRVLRATCDNFGWPFTDWAVDITRDHDPRVLAVYAHEGDNDVVVAYQRTNDEVIVEGLYCAHLDADDGGSFVDVQTFNQWENSGGNLGQWLQVGICRTIENRVAVVAEAVSDDLLAAAVSLGSNAHNILHHVLYREINSDSAARIGNEFSCANLYMVSRPWSYANGENASGSAPNVYCVFSFKSAYDTNDWEQAAIFACDLGYQSWQHSRVVQTSFLRGSNLRPRPIANFVHTGIPDARPSIGGPELASALYSESGLHKRGNHLSSLAGAPPFGPDVKTRTAAVGVWARMGTQRGENAAAVDVAELQPENLGVSGFVVYMENPWTLYRDATDPTQPVDNFKGAFPRAMCQTAGAGRSLFISGGSPSLYDGRQVVECGFLWRPEIFFTDGYTDSNPTLQGALTLLGVYQYYAVYTWRDNAGQMHRSGPSRITTVTLVGTENGIALRTRCMTLSMRDASLYYPHAEDSIQVEFYRTIAGGAKFFRIFGATQVEGAGFGSRMRIRDTPTNDADARFGYLDVYDGVSDANLVLQGLGPYQYNSDLSDLVGPFPQVSPPLTVCCNWLNRVFGADALDPAMIWYTDEIFPDAGSDYALAPFFSTELTYRIGEIGEITAMQPMDNALVVFTASHIFTLTATDAGGGLLAIESTVRHTGTGCIEPRSVVLSPEGVFFQSAKGYYLLNRGFELEADRGAMFEDEVREIGNIAGATILADRPQMRLVGNGRPVTTWTTTWTIAGANGVVGTWSVSFTGYGEVGTYEAGINISNADVASNLAADIQALIDSGAINHLATDASRIGDTLVVTWVADVVPAYTQSHPATTTFTPVDTSSIAFYPRSVLYDNMHRLCSRAELPRVAATTSRLAEVVSATAWQSSNGETLHVYLSQGGLHIERASSDALAFTDQIVGAASVAIPIDVKTSWLNIAGMSGWKRIRSIGIQCERIDAAALTVDLDYDTTGTHNPYDYETETGIQWNSPAPAYARIRPRIQRMTMIRVRIYENSGTTGEHVALYGMTFEVGIERGLRRVADSQTGT